MYPFLCVCLMTIAEAGAKKRICAHITPCNSNDEVHQYSNAISNTCAQTEWDSELESFNGFFVQGRRRWGCWVDENISSTHCHRWMHRRMIISSCSKQHSHVSCAHSFCLFRLSFPFQSIRFCLYCCCCYIFLSFVVRINYLLCANGNNNAWWYLCKGNASKQELRIWKNERATTEAVEVDMLCLWILKMQCLLLSSASLQLRHCSIHFGPSICRV